MTYRDASHLKILEKNYWTLFITLKGILFRGGMMILFFEGHSGAGYWCNVTIGELYSGRRPSPSSSAGCRTPPAPAAFSSIFTAISRLQSSWQKMLTQCQNLNNYNEQLQKWNEKWECNVTNWHCVQMDHLLNDNTSFYKSRHNKIVQENQQTSFRI